MPSSYIHGSWELRMGDFKVRYNCLILVLAPNYKKQNPSKGNRSLITINIETTNNTNRLQCVVSLIFAFIIETLSLTETTNTPQIGETNTSKRASTFFFYIIGRRVGFSTFRTLCSAKSITRVWPFSNKFRLKIKREVGPTE